MKKLVIKIGNETHSFPYNGEAFSFELSEKYVPKVGDCVKVECKNQNRISFHWFKVKEVAQAMADFSLTVGHDFQIFRNGFFSINNNRVYTKITPEELTVAIRHVWLTLTCQITTEHCSQMGFIACYRLPFLIEF